MWRSSFLAVRPSWPFCCSCCLFLDEIIGHEKFMTFSSFHVPFHLLALIGFYLPNLWLHRKIARRKQKILMGFPDALDLMVVCVEAGVGLDAAIKRVGEEMKLGNKVLSEEFKLLSLELRAGNCPGYALEVWPFGPI